MRLSQTKSDVSSAVFTHMRACVTLLLICNTLGCAFGPKSVELDRRRYNESVEHTNREELLLNIVRLRYEDSPGTLKIPGLTTQRSWIKGAQAAGAFGPDAPNLAELAGSTTWTERPTISYSTGSRDQSMAALTPLSTETLFALTLTGWKTTRLWTLIVENVNGVTNARGASGPVPMYPPDFGRFQSAVNSIQNLIDSDGVDISKKRMLVPVSPPIPIESISPREIRDATAAGYHYELAAEDASMMVLNKVDMRTVLRFSPDAIMSPDGQIVFDVLGLDRDATEFDLKVALGGKMTTSIEPDGERKHILVTPRSLRQIMYFLSKGVDLPCDHVEEGIVRVTQAGDGQCFNWKPAVGCFAVRCAEDKPKDAAIAIPYRDYWFYIEDCDTNSKRTMLLLDQIIEAQIEVGGAENVPVLTLPL